MKQSAMGPHPPAAEETSVYDGNVSAETCLAEQQCDMLKHHCDSLHQLAVEKQGANIFSLGSIRFILRRREAVQGQSDNLSIPFHYDIARVTVNIGINSVEDYDGGQHLFFTEGRSSSSTSTTTTPPTTTPLSSASSSSVAGHIVAPSRPRGSAFVIRNTMLHGVSKLRYLELSTNTRGCSP